jgi:glycosyltransferase involved in cell wall biosynthesis
MNILFLNNFHYLRGGSEKVLFEEMRLLRENGHRVAVYARGHEQNEPAGFAEFFPPPLDTEHLNPSIKTVLTVTEMIYSRAARRGLGEVLKRFRPDIVHAHNIYGRLSVSVLDELKGAQVPIVLTLHDLKLLCPSYLMLNRGKVCEKCKGHKFYHAVLSRCHKNSYPASAVYAFETWMNTRFGKYDPVRYFITPSRFLRDKAIEFDWCPERFIHVPNFIDLASVTDASVIGGYCLYLGRLSREKGLKTLLQAFRALRPKLPLHIVGDGPDRDELEKLTSDDKLAVHFAGHLSGKRLHEAIADAKVIIVPSECYENAPMSILEAMAHGKPVIGARIGGIPEMIDDGVTGYLFEPGNVADLRDKLEQFLSLPDAEVDAMGRSARNKVEKEHSAEAHYTGLMQVYSKALNGFSAKSTL